MSASGKMSIVYFGRLHLNPVSDGIDISLSWQMSNAFDNFGLVFEI